MVALLSMRAAPRVVPNSRFSIPAKFTATHRLLRENGFDHVVRAENIADRHFKVYFVRNGQENARLGMIVGKKMLPGAADRNRVKRMIREVFRQHNIKLRKLDVVVRVRSILPGGGGAQADNLEMLFSQVENRCAES
ncbi:MAG: ribonuclease P protein component [Gallionella sp.]|nr:ribonuclease P protein component [Gallionella sp.]